MSNKDNKYKSISEIAIEINELSKSLIGNEPSDEEVNITLSRENTLHQVNELRLNAAKILDNNNDLGHLTTIEKGLFEMTIGNIKYCIDKWEASLNTAISDNRR